MNFWNWLFGRKKEEARRKRKILLGTLIPISLILIALSAFLGCWYGCDYKATFILKDNNSVTQYLEKHKSIHKGTQHLNKTNLTHDNRQYLRKNLNGANLLNGIIGIYFSQLNWNPSIFGSKWEVKHGKNWASLKTLDDSLDRASGDTRFQFRDRYVFLKKTNDGITIKTEWMTKNNPDNPDEDFYKYQWEWNCKYLNDTINCEISYIPAGLYGIWLNSLLGPLNDDRTYDLVCHFGIFSGINVFGWGGWHDYPTLSKLDYPNVDVIE